jgi:vancomycin resistance protein YoaR
MEEIKKAIDTVAELRKTIEEKLKTISELNRRVKILEKYVSTLSRRVAVQRVIIKHLAKRLRRELVMREAERVVLTRKTVVTRRPERVFKSEEVRRKLEELKKKLMEKRATRVSTPRPGVTTTPEPASDVEEFREFIRKVLSGKATASDLPVKFRVLPEVKIEGGGEKK